MLLSSLEPSQANHKKMTRPKLREQPYETPNETPQLLLSIPS